MKKICYLLSFLFIFYSCQEPKSDETTIINEALKEVSLEAMPSQMRQILGLDESTNFSNFEVYQRQYLTIANDADTSKWVRKKYIFIQNEVGQKLGIEVQKDSIQGLQLLNLVQVNAIDPASRYKDCGIYHIDTSNVPDEIKPLVASIGSSGVFIDVLWVKENLFVKTDTEKWVDFKDFRILTEKNMSVRLKEIYKIDNASINHEQNNTTRLINQNFYPSLIIQNIERRNVFRDKPTQIFPTTQ